MPSRFASAAILVFWLCTTGYIVHRDVWPRLVANTPPPLKIDLVDEATSRVPIRWVIFRNGQKLGSMTTELRYVERDDTFWFDNLYRELKFDFPPLTVYVPEAETGIRVTRDGDLREQKLKGKIEVHIGQAPLRTTLASAEALVTGQVREGILYGHCRIDSSLPATFDKELEPVAVPSGQVLNPMMPVARIRDLQPGKRWVIRQVDPLGQALSMALQEMAKDKSPLGSLTGLGGPNNAEVVATVRSAPETLTLRNGRKVECYVIDYRSGPNEAEAITWVTVDGGRVLRQEARFMDDTLMFERDE